ncbi:hypothetical protein [Bittarella massiliensis (ex Durand et al. 2017)]|uniref:hypothetical protein n=1 Tax=Bittarella massiliensis (ex Durand et al. 2017) TaxID=1720313 RepID=UPI001AA164FF|nr:hypothetical protein [Bittarella massiliensis (ex Durand et al. 2017)]MBO1679886.1 hypothetical protein [Bittarella massiliensis (ex Durand et al. 2017)]
MKKNRWAGALLALCLLLGTLLTGCGRDKEYQYNFDNGCIKAQYDESYWEYLDAGKSGDYYELLFYEKGLDEEETYEEGNLVVVRYGDRRSIDEEEYVDEAKGDERDDGYTVSRESHRSGSVNGSSTSTYKYRLDGSVERTIIFHSDEEGELIIDVWMGAPDRAVGDKDLVNSIRRYGPLSDYEWSFDGQTDPGGSSSSGSSGSQPSGSESGAPKPAEGFTYLSQITLQTEGKSLGVYCLEDEDIYLNGDYASTTASGIELTTFLFTSSGAGADTPKEQVRTDVEGTLAVKGSLDFYSDVAAEELLTGDGWALQQVNFNYIGYDGEKYPGFVIHKVDQVDANTFLSIEVEVNGYDADNTTRPAFEEVCKAFGIQFDFGD